MSVGVRLRYRSNICVGDLAVGECTMHRAGDSNGGRWWLLWFRVNREDNGQAADFAVPVNPNGGFVEDGPGGRTWGLARSDQEPSSWQIAPSVNVLVTTMVLDGDHHIASQWHQTPLIVGVPGGEAWVSLPP